MPQEKGFLEGLLDSISSGARQSFDSIRDDASVLWGGGYNPGTMGRLFDVLQEMPIGKGVAKFQNSSLAQKIKHEGGRFFHGTPHTFKDLKPSREGLAGPGVYATNTPEVAGEYAKGATQPGMLNPMPNIHSLQVAPHETFSMDQFLNRSDMDMLRNALLDPKKMKGMDDTARRAAVNMTSGGLGQGSTGADLMYNMENLFGTPGTQVGNQKAVNDMLREAGFQSIQYAGGRRMGNGGPLHDALNVIDPSIMQPYVDYAARQKQSQQGAQSLMDALMANGFDLNKALGQMP